MGKQLEKTSGMHYILTLIYAFTKDTFFFSMTNLNLNKQLIATSTEFMIALLVEFHNHIGFLCTITTTI